MSFTGGAKRGLTTYVVRQDNLLQHFMLGQHTEIIKIRCHTFEDHSGLLVLAYQKTKKNMDRPGGLESFKLLLNRSHFHNSQTCHTDMIYSY